MSCLACVAEIHTECLKPDGVYCCCPPLQDEFIPTGKLMLEQAGRSGGYKQANDMIDPLSTGRKRAAELKPIKEGMLCEWSGLAKAGGGVYPIIGCLDSPARHIHHGPDKNTTNNDEGNLHRVCSKCHNRWHSLNDRFYGNRPPAGYPFVPPQHVSYTHDGETKASVEKTLAHELWWNLKSKHRSTGYDGVNYTGAARGLPGVGDVREGVTTGDSLDSRGSEGTVNPDSVIPDDDQEFRGLTG